MSILIMHFWQITRDIPEHLFPSSKFIERALHPGPPTKLLTFEDAIQFILVLPGEIAKEIRVQFGKILERYMAGDKTLHGEIIVNAASNSPVAQMARESLGLPAMDEALVGFKRKREELELIKLEEEIKGMVQARLSNLEDKLERISDPTSTKMDERARLLFKDTYMNLLLNAQVSPTQAVIANGPSPNAPISISSVAAELGYKPTTDDSKRIGVDLRRRYIKTHGKPPPKHDQLCGGLVMKINSYTEKDRALLTETLHAYYKTSESDDSDSDGDN